MDDVDRIVVVEDEHDLERTAGCGTPPHQPLVVRPFEWVGLPRCHHDVLCLFRPHAVAGNVLYVPFVPSELGHYFLYKNQAQATKPDTLRRSRRRGTS